MTVSELVVAGESTSASVWFVASSVTVRCDKRLIAGRGALERNTFRAGCRRI